MTLFVVATVVLFGGCSKGTFLSGRYLAAQEDVSDIRIQFSLNDLNGNEYHYFTRLRPNGSFRFRINKSGRFLLTAGIVEFSMAKWHSPSLSNDSEFYPIYIPGAGTIDIGKNYISDAIRIFSPAEHQAISLTGDFVVKWQAVTFADYYSVHIYSRDSTGERRNVISVFNIRNPEISLSDLRRMQIVTGELDFETILRKSPFVRQKQELAPGSYGILVDAYAIDTKEERFISVAHSPNNWEIRMVK
jgi:hypothetical protein